MSRSWAIEQHKRAREIIVELIAGTGTATIAKRFGLNVRTLRRYRQDRLPQHLAQRAAAAQPVAPPPAAIKDAETYWRAIENALDIANRIYRACDEYLADPDRPGEWYLGPRAHDVDITYVDGKEGPRRRAPLSELLGMAREKRDIEVLGSQYRYADPAKLVLEAARRLAATARMLAELQERLPKPEADQIGVATLQIMFIQQVQQVIIAETADHPEVRERIAERFHAMQEAAEDDGGA